jgi:ribonuclease HI
VKPTSFDSIIVFTDGACTGNPGPGGWAAIMALPGGAVKELGGKSPETTNNRMELLGAIKGLAAIDTPAKDIIMYTDSTYVIRGITQWIWAWRKNSWRGSSGKEVSNRDLWEELSRQVTRLKPAKIDWKYVRGHTGVPGNERCDEIAVCYSKGKRIDLYSGPLLKYPVAIYDLPEDQPLPEMRTIEAKPAAYSYLSLHGGIIMRHETWAECERRVKGQSQAKFKKAKSEQDEREILKSWGFDPDKAVIQE